MVADVKPARGSSAPTLSDVTDESESVPGDGPSVDPVVDGGRYEERTLRGGYWSLLAQDCRSAARYPTRPDIGLDRYGFRVARWAD